MVFIETAYFTRIVADYLSDGEQGELQTYLVEHPDDGILSRVVEEFEKYGGGLRARGKVVG